MEIFFSVPFSSKLDKKGKVLPVYKKDLQTIISGLEEEGHKVYCAPKADGWKLQQIDPAKALHADFKKIDKCDIFVALLGEVLSTGVQLETGYALAKGKRIVLISRTNQRLGWTNNAIIGFENVSSLNFDFYDEAAAQILRLTIK